jgi:branched-chain amino acid transport system permease protein
MGVAGALFTASVSTIDFGLFHPMSYTFLVWVMLMAGGSGNHKGAVFGGICYMDDLDGHDVFERSVGALSI